LPRQARDKRKENSKEGVLFAQILHVQWGWSDEMSNSAAAQSAGLQSIDWRSLASCRNGSMLPRGENETAPASLLVQKGSDDIAPHLYNGLQLQRGAAAAELPAQRQALGAPGTIAATPPMGACDFKR
jgi:hypothetical protein